MNYIILNGKKSTLIKGLLISSLPPISKPLIRTQIEEIDGRDGDIVTTLGYAAYDKQMTIGLYGDYDINEVIAYFDSEGMVTFSNEPDKFYNYQIIDQIDFERLIRFRTATVTFHCQPYKFSTVEKAVRAENRLITLTDYTTTATGITVEASSRTVKVSGTASSATEIYIPITPVSISAGTYSLYAYSIGTSPNVCSIRLINDSPSSANSFGGTYVTLSNGNAVSINATLSGTKTYNYLYLYITAGTAVNFRIVVNLQNNDSANLDIVNNGNIISKPKVTLYGSGVTDLYLNGFQIFRIDCELSGGITIDTALMEATVNGILRNRQVSGDYDNFSLQVGENTLSWTGLVAICVIENYSRWI